MDATKYLLNLPTPGESLTVESGAYPYENPPLLDSTSEGMKYIMDQYYNNNIEEEILKLIIAGVNIEYLADIIVKSAFMNGIFTVDVAEILKPALLLHMLADARDAGVEKIKIFSDANVLKVSDKQFIDIYEDLREEEEEEIIEETPLPEIAEGSFLDMEIR